jgi:trimeric autotransporter adhesin
MSLILDGTTGIVTINASSSGVGGIASNTALGSQALSATGQVGTGNTAIGGFALGTNVSGIDNTAIGYGAGYYITSNGNTAVGRSALSTASPSTGGTNTAVGFYSLQATTSGGANTALGYQSGYNNTIGQFNVLLGYQAGYRSAGVGTIGDASVFIGYQAGYANQGNNNVGIGNGALTAQTSGTFNVGIGQGSGGAITTGTKNSILGSYTGNQAGSGTATLDLRTATNNIVISDGDGNPRGRYNDTGMYEQRAATYAYKRVIVAQSAFDNPVTNLMAITLSNNQMTAIKVSVMQAVFASTASNYQIGMASAQNNGSGTAVSAVTSMSVQINNGLANVGTLSWSISGNTATLRYTSNRAGNYDSYFIMLEISNAGNQAVTLY